MSVIQSHLQQVARRVVAQRCLRDAAWAVTAGIAVAGANVVSWRLLQVGAPALPLAIGAVGMGIVGLAIAAAMRMPPEDECAALLDREMGTKDRYVTWLDIREDGGDMARAARLDAERLATQLSLAGRFAVRPDRTWRWAGLAAVALAATWWGLPQMDLLGKATAKQQLALAQQRQAQTKRDLEDIKARLGSQEFSALSPEALASAGKIIDQAIGQVDQGDIKAANHAAQKAIEALKDELKRQQEQEHASPVKLEKLPAPGPDEKGTLADARRALNQGDLPRGGALLRQSLREFEQASTEDKDKMQAQMDKLAQDLKRVAEDLKNNKEKAAQDLAKQLAGAGLNPQAAQQIAEAAAKAAAGDPAAQQELKNMMEQAAKGLPSDQAQQLANQIQQGQQAMAQGAKGQKQAQQLANAAGEAARAMKDAQQDPKTAGQKLSNAENQLADAAGGQAEEFDKMAQELDKAGQQAQGNNGQGPGGQRPADGNAGGEGIGNGGQRDKTTAGFATSRSRSGGLVNEEGRILAGKMVDSNGVKNDQRIALQGVVKAAQAARVDEVADQAMDAQAREVMRRYFETLARDAMPVPPKGP